MHPYCPKLEFIGDGVMITHNNTMTFDWVYTVRACYLKFKLQSADTFFECNNPTYKIFDSGSYLMYILCICLNLIKTKHFHSTNTFIRCSFQPMKEI